jgi:exonuclease SbcD
MRFIHTADWHLGRLFHGVHLTADQAYVLDQFVELAREARPDVILIAGDIYDRAVPPPDAVELLDHVLSRLVIDLQIPVLLIAGNHDSPGRLNFASRLLAGRRLYVTGMLPKVCEPLVLHDEDGPVQFFGVPYAEPAMVRACLGCGETAGDHNAATKAYLDSIRASRTPAQRRVLIGHAFVAGGAACESERPLSVGGAGTVDAAHFHGFNYVALGHLHGPQSLSSDGSKDRTLHYSGSLLKYSFDEALQRKVVYTVEMDALGRCRREAIALKPRRDVRRLAGRLGELLKPPPSDSASRDDYLEVTLLDDGPVLDAIGQLREIYPNVLSVRPAERPDASGLATLARVRTSSDAELFESFFRHVTGDEPTAAQRAAFIATIDAMTAAQREVTLDRDVAVEQVEHAHVTSEAGTG